MNPLNVDHHYNIFNSLNLHVELRFLAAEIGVILLPTEHIGLKINKLMVNLHPFKRGRGQNSSRQTCIIQVCDQRVKKTSRDTDIYFIIIISRWSICHLY